MPLLLVVILLSSNSSSSTPPHNGKNASDGKSASFATEGMARLPAGKLKMHGRPVKVEPFLLDVTAVTVAAYAECVKHGNCSEPATGGFCNWGKSERANHPINCVDWNQATAYCAWVGKRLPRGEEREWAARGARAGTLYPWGNEDPSNQLCWSGPGIVKRRDVRSGTCAVGSYPAGNSPHGLKDLAGNVWEWTSTEPGLSGPNRFMRGGSWRDDEGGDGGTTATFSSWGSLVGAETTHRSEDLGFRCASTP